MSHVTQTKAVFEALVNGYFSTVETLNHLSMIDSREVIARANAKVNDVELSYKTIESEADGH
jgi:hypothetical protein